VHGACAAKRSAETSLPSPYTLYQGRATCNVIRGGVQSGQFYLVIGAEQFFLELRKLGVTLLQMSFDGKRLQLREHGEPLQIFKKSAFRRLSMDLFGVPMELRAWLEVI